MLSLLREISLRHWRRSRLRSLLVVIGIGLGIALYTATEAATLSMLDAFADLVQRVSGRADLTIESAGSGVPGELVADVASAPGVAHAAASVELSAQAPELGISLLILGVDFLGDLHFLPFKTEGSERGVVEDPLVFVNDPSAILISKRLAHQHGLHEGSRLRLLTVDGPRDFRVRGVLEDSGPAASFGGQIAVMFIDAAQVSFARGTLVDRIDVALEPGSDRAKQKRELAALVGNSAVVAEPAQLGARVRTLAAPLEASLGVTGFLALLCGAFLVFNAVGVAVAQRRREVGLLRALGVTRAGTILLFCAEAAAQAVPGVAIGLGFGAILARYSVGHTLEVLDTMYTAAAPDQGVFNPDLITRAVAAGLIMAVLAAFWPARRAARLDPAIVLRGSGAVEITPPPVRKLLLLGVAVALTTFLPFFRASQAGAAWLLATIILAGALAIPALVVTLRVILVRLVEALWGVPGRLGLDYVERTLGRSSVNVLALMVAVGLSICAGGWLGSFEHSIREWARNVAVADLNVVQGSPLMDRRHVPFRAELSERVAKVPGVQAIQHFRTVEQVIEGHKLQMIATDTDVFLRMTAREGKGWQLLDGAPLRPSELSRERRVLLSENAAGLLGKRAGDSVTIVTPQGHATFEVRAVIVDYSSESGTLFIDRAHFLRYFADELIDGVSVYLAPGADEEQVARAISAATNRGAGGGSVFVTNTRVAEEHLLDSLRETFSYSRAVEMMTLLIALMGVIGTMAAAVIDRQREIGMLRAVGATTRQVGLAIVVEAGFLGFCAAVTGVVLGIIECRIFFDTLLANQTGWHLEFVFPWASAARTGGLVVLTSALAGALPAWRAARTPLLGNQSQQ